MKSNIKIKNIITISVLIALSVIFSYVDNVISQGLFSAIRLAIPSFKLGLANIVVLVYIYFYRFRDGLIAVILKSILVALLFSGTVGFMIGFTGTILSFIVMTVLHRALKEDKYLIFISLVGAITHSVGQIITAFAIYGIQKIEAWIIYAPYILIISAITGVLVGIVGSKTIKMLKANGLIKTEEENAE